MKTKSINLRIEKTLLDYLEVAARAHRTTRSVILRSIITKYINTFRDITDYEFDDILD